jgi:hypothetical protein
LSTPEQQKLSVRVIALGIAAWTGFLVAHAVRVRFHLADDLYWLRHARAGLGAVWTEPSPFAHFRPGFATWLWLLSRAGLQSPGALCMAGIALSLVTGLLAAWAVAPVVSRRQAWLAAGLFVVSPTRWEPAFWMSAQMDTLCLAFSFACVGLGLRTGQAPGPSLARCCAILGLAFAASVTKEYAALLPVLLAFHPGCGRASRRIVVASAAAAGVVFALVATLDVLPWGGRSGAFVSWARMLALPYYPAHLILPFGSTGIRVVVGTADWVAAATIALATATGVAVAIYVYRRHRDQPWARVGVLWLAAGAVVWGFTSLDRTIGFGCFGMALVVAGAEAHRRGLVLVLCLAWLLPWLTWQSRSLEASERSGALMREVQQWRQAIPRGTLVALGVPCSIGGVPVMPPSEMDACADSIASLESRAGHGGDGVVVQAGPTQGTFTIVAKSGNRLQVKAGVDGVRFAYPDLVPQNAVVDVQEIPRRASCGSPDLRFYDGAHLVPLPDGR